MQVCVEQRFLVSLKSGLVVLLSTLGMIGCVSIHTHLDVHELPAEWGHALATPNQTPSGITGRYRNEGQWLIKGAGRVAPAKLSDWLIRSSDCKDRYSTNFWPDEVELLRPEVGRMQVKLLKGGALVGECWLDADFSESEGAVTVQSHRLRANTTVAAVATQRLKARFYKGTDGRLYARFLNGMTGVAFLLPVNTETESWGRWEAAVTR